MTETYKIENNDDLREILRIAVNGGTPGDQLIMEYSDKPVTLPLTGEPLTPELLSNPRMVAVLRELLDEPGVNINRGAGEDLVYFHNGINALARQEITPEEFLGQMERLFPAQSGISTEPKIIPINNEANLREALDGIFNGADEPAKLRMNFNGGSIDVDITPEPLKAEDLTPEAISLLSQMIDQPGINLGRGSGVVLTTFHNRIGQLKSGEITADQFIADMQSAFTSEKSGLGQEGALRNGGSRGLSPAAQEKIRLAMEGMDGKIGSCGDVSADEVARPPSAPAVVSQGNAKC